MPPLRSSVVLEFQFFWRVVLKKGWDYSSVTYPVPFAWIGPLARRRLCGICVDFLGSPHDDPTLKYPTGQRTSSLRRDGFGSHTVSEDHGVS